LTERCGFIFLSRFLLNVYNFLWIILQPIQTLYRMEYARLIFGFLGASLLTDRGKKKE